MKGSINLILFQQSVYSREIFPDYFSASVTQFQDYSLIMRNYSQKYKFTNGKPLMSFSICSQRFV